MSYWVVGATVNNENMLRYFVGHGFWYGNHPDAQSKISQIKARDRIAIKRMLGRGARKMSVEALGVVEDVKDHDALPVRMVYVRWTALPEPRQVDFKGFGSMIDGPFQGNEQRIAEIFRW